MLLRTPLQYMFVTSPYGPRSLKIGDSHHDGSDLRASIGTRCYPVHDECYVMKARNEDMDAWGKYIVLFIPSLGLQVLYAHLSEVYVEENQLVCMNDVIGLTGNTGSSTGPHLHFGIYASSFDDIFDKDPDNISKHKNSLDPSTFMNEIPKDIIGLPCESHCAIIRSINQGFFQNATQFNPKDPITREQLAIILSRLTDID